MPPHSKAPSTDWEETIVSARVEAMAFDPWHAPVAHGPLGAMMPARNQAYRVSTKERQAASAPEE
jgi:hypothetical protein